MFFDKDGDYCQFIELFMKKIEDGYIWRDNRGSWLKESQMSNEYIKDVIKYCRKYGTTLTKLFLVGMFKEILHKRRKKIKRKKNKNYEQLNCGLRVYN